jgi:molybdate transport system substrate-binding protein
MTFLLRRLRLLLLPFCLLLSSASLAAEPPLRIAAASDLAPCIAELNAGFAAQGGGQASVTIGSSGNFFAQIKNGAPFDVFLSADTAYPRALADAGLADPSSLYVYAYGRLVLWSADPGLATDAGLRLLTHPAVRRVAIANPDVAPYGKAAKAALQHAGLWQQLQPKLVYGESIAQTMQFVESGNAQVGLVSGASTSNARRPGWTVPADSYPAIEQGAIVTVHGRTHPQAARYLQFLRSDHARATLMKYGFALPPGQ